MARKPQVVLVVSEPADLDTLTVALAKDVDVVPAASMREALSIAESREIDVVCADRRLKDGSGLDLLRKIAMLSRATGCVLMADFKDVSREERTDDRITGLVFKPFQPQQVREIVARVAQVTQMRRELKRVSQDLGGAPKK